MSSVKLLTSIQFAPKKVFLVKAEIVAELMQQRSPYFVAKDSINAAGRRPQILDEQNNLGRRAGALLRAKNIAHEESQRLWRNAGLNERRPGCSIHNERHLCRSPPKPVGQLVVQRLGNLNGTTTELIKSGSAAPKFHGVKGAAKKPRDRRR